MGWGKVIKKIVKPIVKIAKPLVPAAIGFAVGGPVGAAAGLGFSLMKGGLSKAAKVAKPPEPEKPPEPPSLASKTDSGQTVLEEGTKRALAEVSQARGRASTMTGAGDTEEEKYNARKRLLGY